jgi:hypothetical protein
MKPSSLLFSIIFSIGCIYSSINAQDLEILDPNLQIKNFKFEQEVYIPEMGTKGVMFIFEYYYSTSSKYLVTFPQVLNAYKYGIEVFSDSSSFLVMRPNQWGKARKFIPYRAIDVPEGQHDDIEVKYSVDGVVNFKGIMAFRQPARYAVNLNMKAASVKPKAGSYDPGVSPKEAAPDIYWTVTTDEGLFPAYTSKMSMNSNKVNAESANFYVLEGEKLVLNFYDEDEGEDLKLGSTVISENANVDFKKDQLGRMFGSMKGVTYTIGQRKSIRQPITTYVRKDYEYKGRKGVQLIFDYFLPAALEGRQMKPSLKFRNKNKDILKFPYHYNLDGATKIGEAMQLTQEGKLAYFVPHYAWNSNIHTIEFAFQDGNDRAEAAPYFIHNPINFGKFVSYTSYSVEEDYNYLGTSGVKLSVSYKVEEMHKYSDLELNFLDEAGAPILFDIYPIDADASRPVALPNNPYTIKEMQEEDTLEYFIPYIDLNANKIRLEMNLVPDMIIPVIKETSPRLKRPAESTDGITEKLAEESQFREGDYGFIVKLRCEVPAFYKDRVLLDVKAKRNNVHFLGYSVVGDMVEQLAVDTFSIKGDTGVVYVILPYRRLEPNDKISIECKLIERSKGVVLSEAAVASANLPANIHNVDAQFDLKLLEFTPETKADEDDNSVDWKYVLTVGNEAKISKTLKKKVKGKEMTSKFSRTVRVHREDLIQIKVVNKKNEKEEIFLWSGDLGKFKQSKFKNMIKDQTPVKKAKVKAVVSKKQLEGK